MVRKKVTTELEKAEVKLQSLYDHRDQANEEAQGVRQERDLLSNKRKELVDEMRRVRDQRVSAVKELRQHRDRRNSFHQEARHLIELKRKARGNLHKGIATDLSRLRREIDDMDWKQETTVLTLAKENELIKELRLAMKEFRVLEKEKGAQERVFKEVKEIDTAIDDLMKKADTEHAQVVLLANRAQEHHDKVTELMREIAVLIAEADKKHEEFMEARKKADAYHEKAVEMRDKVLTERKAGRAEEMEERRMLRDQNRTVRATLLDKKKLDEAADKALESLLKQGKVEIRG